MPKVTITRLFQALKEAMVLEKEQLFLPYDGREVNSAGLLLIFGLASRWCFLIFRVRLKK